MPENNFYEYAVIRILPKVEREEFINVGLVLFSKSAKYLKAKFHINESRLGCYDHELDLEEIKANLAAFSSICEGRKDIGGMAMEDLPSRFRWLTALRSTSLQTSRPHVGFSADLHQTFDRLFAEMVQ